MPRLDNGEEEVPPPLEESKARGEMLHRLSIEDLLPERDESGETLVVMDLIL